MFRGSKGPALKPLGCCGAAPMCPEWCHTPPSCGGRLGPSFILLTKHSGSLAPADPRRSPTRCQATQHPDAELTESQRKMANAPILAMWVTSLREWLSVLALGTTWTTQMAIPVSQGLTSCACCLPLCHRSKTGHDLILPSFCLLPLDVVSPCALPASSFSLKLHDPSQLPLGPDSSVLRLCPATASNLFQAHRCYSHQGNLPWLLSPPACLQGLQGLGDPRKTIEDKDLSLETRPRVQGSYPVYEATLASEDAGPIWGPTAPGAGQASGGSRDILELCRDAYRRPSPAWALFGSSAASGPGTH